MEKLTERLTEQQIEHIVEQRFNRLDARLLDGRITNEEYEAESQNISRWADRQYRSQ